MPREHSPDLRFFSFLLPKGRKLEDFSATFFFCYPTGPDGEEPEIHDIEWMAYEYHDDDDIIPTLLSSKNNDLNPDDEEALYISLEEFYLDNQLWKEIEEGPYE